MFESIPAGREVFNSFSGTKMGRFKTPQASPKARKRWRRLSRHGHRVTRDRSISGGIDGHHVEAVRTGPHLS